MRGMSEYACSRQGVSPTNNRFGAILMRAGTFSSLSTMWEQIANHFSTKNPTCIEEGFGESLAGAHHHRTLPDYRQRSVVADSQFQPCSILNQNSS